MADYRKRLIDMTEEERAAVAPGSPSFDERYENVGDPLSVQMMEAGLDFTPVGVVKGVSDIKDELSKDDPNYLKALGMGAVEAAGIIPGAAPVLKGMVRGSFKTSKGSVYDVFDDSTTVRNRAERGDSESVGIQPRSGKTIYMTREGVDQLGPLFQNTEIPVQFVPVEGRKAKLVYTQDYGPKKAGMDASPEVPYTLDPEVGLHPVEILDSRNTNRRNIHFGNDITVVESNVPSTKGINKQVSNAEYDARIAKLDEASDADSWQKEAKDVIKEGRVSDPSVKTPELEDSTRMLLENKITREEHLSNVDKYKPVDAWDALPREPSDKALVFALDSNKRRDGLFVLDDKIAEELGVPQSPLNVGMRYNGRLDIPAYTNHDTWIVAGTSPAVKTSDGKSVTTYAKAIHYVSDGDKPVKFIASEKTSARIGTGEANKSGYATVSGIVGDLDVNDIRAKAAQYLNDPEWTQVGFDPRRQGGFYVRAGDNKHVPVREASEVIQIGPLVLARNAKLDFEHTGYAEGGAVMDEQMEMAFGDAGERVDPVSGNEVPTGSLPEEVRDDIPAQLSEGEYVVPADVVRYYGVKFFEDLRSEAKTGFNQMQANGRIGGEPMGMEVVDPQDDLDIMFDDSDFEVTDGPDGYADGGVVTPTDFGIYVPETMEMREYVNAEGNTITIMFFNGMPMSAIPEGYTYVNPEPDPATTGGAVTTAADVPSFSDDGPPVVPSSTVEPTNYKELTPSELQALVEEQRSMTQDVIAGIGGIVNPILGLAMKVGMWHTSRQVTKELERRIADPENADLKDKYAELLEYHESDTDSYYNRIMDTIEGKERDKLPFDIDAADPAAINAAIEEGLLAEEGYSPDNIDEMPTGMDPIAAPEPIELTSLNDEPGARDYKGPLAGLSSMLDTKGGLPEPYVFKPETPALSDNASAFLASEDKVIADQRREKIKERMAQKQAERQRKLDALQAQISAKDSLARAAADKGDDNDSHKTMMKAAATKQRNKAAGLGAQTKKGSTAGSKSGYFD